MLLTPTQLTARLKKEPAGAYLFCGEEAYLRRAFQGELRKKLLTDPDFDTFNHIIREGTEIDYAALRADLETPPFFAPSKLVEWQGADLSSPKDGDYDRLAELVRGLEDAPGVSLLPHTTPGLAAKGKAGKMYRLRDGKYTPDDFSHEQSLVFQTDRGLIIFNSCCHAGADVIVRETQEAFPGQTIRALVGGFHLFETPDEEVYALGQRLAESGVEEIVTGHCTGERGFQILKEVLGARATQLRTGLVLNF